MRIVQGGAEFSHPKGPNHDHIFHMNYDGEFESWCLWALDDSISQHDARQLVYQSLEGGAPPPGVPRWQDAQGIEFTGNSTPCNQDPDNPGGAHRWALYFYTDDHIEPLFPSGSPCADDAAGCAVLGGNYYGSAPDHPEPERKFGKIYLETDYLLERPTYLVSHEVGHALGLDDGEPNDCPPSIMHYDGCTRPDWPTAQDIVSVQSLQPIALGGSSGGGGVVGDGKW